MIETVHIILLAFFSVVTFTIYKNFKQLGAVVLGTVVTSVIAVVSLFILRIIVINIYMPWYNQRDDWAPFLGAFFGMVYGAIGGAIFGLLFALVLCKDFRWFYRLIIGSLFGSLYGAFMLCAIWSVTAVPANPFTDDIEPLFDAVLLLLFPLLGAVIGKFIEGRLAKSSRSG